MIVVADDIAPTPWRNGGGVARDLLFWPSEADWRVRVTLADIQGDGPFSAYPGVERWFAIASGEGVELELAGGPVRVLPGAEPITFDGALAPACRCLAGPVQAFNLMLRGGARGVMRLTPPQAVWLESWPRRGRYDVANRVLEWDTYSDKAGDAAFWIGVQP